MNDELSPNSQAILLLTAPLLAGKSGRSAKPLSLGEYGELVRSLRETGRQPADLLDPGELKFFNEFRHRLDIDRVHRLLGRGFLLAQAVERWRARAIWVVTRADDDYPRRMKERMREKASPVLYGCGDRSMMDGGGLAVVGSRHVDADLIRYTEATGCLAAEADVNIVSGGARGVDQAAMRGALDAGGRALGILANGLERAAVNRNNRAAIMEGRLVLVCPYDPAVRFLTGYAMERNKLIYGLADAALVVNSDDGNGGTWAGATEQLGKLHFVPVYVRRSGEPCAGLDALLRRGARPWPDPEDPTDLREVLFDDASLVPKPAEAVQQELFASEHDVVPGVSGVRESAPPEFGERKISTDLSASLAHGPRPGKAAMRLLNAMSGKMKRKEILAALALKSWSHVKKQYLDPCQENDWIEMTMPDNPRSPNQRFRITPAGTAQIEAFEDS